MADKYTLEDIEREWNRQFDEQGGFTYGESTMKITKNQLKRIIKEEKARLLKEQRAIVERANLLDAMDEFCDVLDAEMGYGVPNGVLKEQVLLVVDEYFDRLEVE